MVQVCGYSFAAEKITTVSVGELIGCVALSKNNELIFASKSGFGLLDRDAGTKLLQHPETLLPTNRFNEGKCDVTGRLWAGAMAIDETESAGSLYCFDGRDAGKK
jgi:sugar lactone lactonase YvrE